MRRKLAIISVFLLAFSPNAKSDPTPTLTKEQIRKEGDSIFGADIDLAHLIKSDCKPSSPREFAKNCTEYRQRALDLERRAANFNSNDAKVKIFGNIYIYSIQMLNESGTTPARSQSPSDDAGEAAWRGLPKREKDSGTEQKVAGAILSAATDPDPYAGTSHKLDVDQIEMQRNAFKTEKEKTIAIAEAAVQASLAVVKEMEAADQRAAAQRAAAQRAAAQQAAAQRAAAQRAAAQQAAAQQAAAQQAAAQQAAAQQAAAQQAAAQQAAAQQAAAQQAAAQQAAAQQAAAQQAAAQQAAAQQAAAQQAAAQQAAAAQNESGQSAIDCLEVRHIEPFSGWDREVVNRCNYGVNVSWCFLGVDCKHGTWGTGAGAWLGPGGRSTMTTTFKATAGKTVYAIACKGRYSSMSEIGEHEVICGKVID